MSSDYVWYTKPGWWIFIICSIGFVLMIATIPSAPDSDFDTQQKIFHNVRCYTAPESDSQMPCDNPAFYHRPTPRSPVAGTTR